MVCCFGFGRSFRRSTFSSSCVLACASRSVGSFRASRTGFTAARCDPSPLPSLFRSPWLPRPSISTPIPVAARPAVPPGVQPPQFLFFPAASVLYIFLPCDSSFIRCTESTVRPVFLAVGLFFARLCKYTYLYIYVCVYVCVCACVCVCVLIHINRCTSIGDRLHVPCFLLLRSIPHEPRSRVPIAMTVSSHVSRWRL